MTRQELKDIVEATLLDIAPEAELDSLDPSEDVRDALDLDSMDILRFATALHEKLSVDIPEADYPRIVSIDGCLDYLMQRL